MLALFQAPEIGGTNWRSTLIAQQNRLKGGFSHQIATKKRGQTREETKNNRFAILRHAQRGYLFSKRTASIAHMGNVE